MPVPFNDLSRGVARDRAALAAVFDAALADGYFVHGPRHAAFERELAAYLGVTDAIGVASGTDALELAIKALMPSGKTRVVTAANAGGYTSTAARRAGYGVRYADVDPDTLCVTPATLAEVDLEGVGVVVVTHLYGNAGGIADVSRWCEAHEIALVEDCAQAIGAVVGGKAAGSWGDAAAISFYPTKNLGALGDGGAVVTSSSAVAERIRVLRQYGWSPKYDAVSAGGMNSRLDDLQAGFLSHRLGHLDAHNERRRQIVAFYRQAARELDPALFSVMPADEPSHVAHLAVARSSSRDRVRQQLRDAGVVTEVHFPVPDYRQAGFEADPISLPVTDDACASVLSLPCFPELTDDEVATVGAAIRSLT